MTALARQRFSEYGKTDRRSSDVSAAGHRHASTATVRRVKSWFGARALGLMGVGGLELTSALNNLESAAPLRG